MLRNDIFDFCRLGVFIERMDNTARIIDVKYYALLPSPSLVGSRMDNVQWETILRSVSAHRSFRWAMDGEMNVSNIASFLILDRRMPRSLSFCISQIEDCLDYLADDYGTPAPCLDMAKALQKRLKVGDMATIFDEGLHEFLTSIISDTAALGARIEEDYRFTH